MNNYYVIDKYIYDNIIEGTRNPGIFSYNIVSAFIKDCVNNKVNINPESFIREMIMKHKNNWSYFIPVIAKEIGIDEVHAANLVKRRLKRAYYGIFGEAVFENMISKSDLYSLMPLSTEDDYKKKVDLKVCSHTTFQIVYFQIKTINWLAKPSDWQKNKLLEEKEAHERLNLDVQYVFFNFDFNNRYFQIDDNKLFIRGYGNGNIRDLNKVLDSVFMKFEVTPQNIIF